MKTFYPKLNKGWCWLFAYAFVSRIWWVGCRCSRRWSWWVYNIGEWIDKEASAQHYVVEYEEMFFDWHDFKDPWDWRTVDQKVDKQYLAVAVLEWWWNEEFYRSGIYTNSWECMYDFLYNFESQLDKMWIKYSSRL